MRSCPTVKLISNMDKHVGLALLTMEKPNAVSHQEDRTIQSLYTTVLYDKQSASGEEMYKFSSQNDDNESDIQNCLSSEAQFYAHYSITILFVKTK